MRQNEAASYCNHFDPNSQKASLKDHRHLAPFISAVLASDENGEVKPILPFLRVNGNWQIWLTVPNSEADSICIDGGELDHPPVLRQQLALLSVTDMRMRAASQVTITNLSCELLEWHSKYPPEDPFRSLRHPSRNLFLAHAVTVTLKSCDIAGLAIAERAEVILRLRGSILHKLHATAGAPQVVLEEVDELSQIYGLDVHVAVETQLFLVAPREFKLSALDMECGSCIELVGDTRTYRLFPPSQGHPCRVIMHGGSLATEAMGYGKLEFYGDELRILGLEPDWYRPQGAHLCIVGVSPLQRQWEMQGLPLVRGEEIIDEEPLVVFTAGRASTLPIELYSVRIEAERCIFLDTCGSFRYTSLRYSTCRSDVRGGKTLEIAAANAG